MDVKRLVSARISHILANYLSRLSKALDSRMTVHVLEADYGIGPLIDVEDAINAGIEKLLVRNKQEPWFDGFWMNEYGEMLFGSLLVVSQAYCVASVADINKIRESLGLVKLSKKDAYNDHHSANQGFSLIELLNSAANCFKHRDEWENGWPNNYTTKTLHAFSITAETEFPINVVLQLIEFDSGYKKITNLVSEWREGLIVKAKNKN